MLAGSPPYGGTAVLPAARRSEGDPAQLERQWLSAAQPLTFGGIGNFKDRRSHPLVPVQVRLGGSDAPTSSAQGFPSVCGEGPCAKIYTKKSRLNGMLSLD